jgi:hypothetical protein
MRFHRSRRRGSSALAVVGGCLAVYVVLAAAFHWLMEPTVAKNQAVVAYQPSPARIAQDVSLARVTLKPPTSAPVTAAAAKSRDTARSDQPSGVATKPLPMMVAAAPKPTDTARSDLPSAVATKPPPMMVTAAATPSTDAVRPDLPSRVASEPPSMSTTMTLAAPESTEPAAAPTEPKKKKVARKTVRRDRSREIFNPFNFFASSPSNGARRWF